MEVRATKISNYKLIESYPCATHNLDIYPYLKDPKGKIIIDCISPLHGRSFILNQTSDFHWIVGKGNGLSYSSFNSLHTSQLDTDTWGRLSVEQALRDFKIGNELRELGLKTNRMEYVLELPFNVIFRGIVTKAALLQYSVECPYRIADYGFIPHEILVSNVNKWTPRNLTLKTSLKHLIAADVLYFNLKTLHDNDVLHNAITPQNYTWALELLDFEASHTPQMPYSTKEYRSYIPMLRDMEIVQNYEIVNYIAWCLNETPDYKTIESIMQSYGFNLKSTSI